MNASTEVGSARDIQVQGASEPEIQTHEEAVLIDETIENIKSIFNKGVTETYIKIGTLIVEKIYNEKLEDIDFSKGPSKKNKEKHLLFKRLAEEIEKRSEKGEVLPQKTWLYNSVRLVADEQLLKECKSYGKLSISHKIALLRLTDKNQKIEIVNEITNKKLSVRITRDLLDKKPAQEINDLASLIGNIENIGSFNDFINSEFDGLTPDDPSIRPALRARRKQLRQIEKELESCRKMVEKYQEAAGSKEALKSQVELIIGKLSSFPAGSPEGLKVRKRNI